MGSERVKTGSEGESKEEAMEFAWQAIEAAYADGALSAWQGPLLEAAARLRSALARRALAGREPVAPDTKGAIGYVALPRVLAWGIYNHLQGVELRDPIMFASDLLARITDGREVGFVPPPRSAEPPTAALLAASQAGLDREAARLGVTMVSAAEMAPRSAEPAGLDDGRRWGCARGDPGCPGCGFLPTRAAKGGACAASLRGADDPRCGAVYAGPEPERRQCDKVLGHDGAHVFASREMPGYVQAWGETPATPERPAPLEERSPDVARGIDLHVTLMRWSDKWVARAKGWGVVTSEHPEKALATLLGKIASTVQGRYRQRVFKEAVPEATPPRGTRP